MPYEKPEKYFSAAAALFQTPVSLKIFASTSLTTPFRPTHFRAPLPRFNPCPFVFICG
jgi:hypothetical protein